MIRTSTVRAALILCALLAAGLGPIAAAVADPAPTLSFNYNVQFAQSQINPWNSTIGQPLNENLFLGASWNTSSSGGDIWKDPIFGSHWGAEFSAQSNGRVGINLNLESDRSYVDINYNNDVKIDVWDEGAQYRLRVTTVNNNTSSSPTVTTAFNPIIRVSGVIEAYAHIDAELCLGGCVSGGVTLLDINAHPTLFTINENYDGYARPFGLDLPLLKKQMQSNHLDIPLTTSVPVLADGQPLKNPFETQYGVIKVKIPQLNGHSNGSGLTAVSTDDHLLSLNADIIGIATIAAGLPLNPFDVRYDIGGGITARGNLLTVLAGVKFGLKQEVDFNPNLRVMLRSDVDINFTDSGGHTLNTDDPDTLTLSSFGQDIYFDKPAGQFNIFPEIRLEAPTIHNDMRVTAGFNFEIEALRMGLSWKSIGPSIGPLFEYSVDTPQADLGSIFDSDLNLSPDNPLLQRKIYTPILGTGPIARDFVAGEVVEFSGKNGVYNTTSIAGTVALTHGTVFQNFNQLTVSGALILQDDLTYMRTEGLEIAPGGTVAVGEGTELDTTGNNNVASGMFSGGVFGAGKTLILGGGKLTYNGDDVRTNNGSIYVTGLNASGSNLVNVAGGAHSGLRYIGTNNGLLVVDAGVLETTSNFTNSATGVMKVVNQGLFKSHEFHNLGDLEISGNSRIEAGGQWKNVDANGVLDGNYVFGRGTIAYNGVGIETIKGQVSFIGGPGFGGNYIENNGGNGLANLKFNEGLLHIETPENGDIADVTVGGNFTNKAGARLEIVGSDDIDRAALRVNGNFFNLGELVVAHNGQLHAGGLGSLTNLDSDGDLGKLTGGKWFVSGTIFYSGPSIAEIASGAELTIVGNGFDNDRGIGEWNLHKNSGVFTLMDNHGLVHGENQVTFQNFGTMNLFSADFTVSDMTNSGIFVVGDNAQLIVNGTQDYDNDSNPIPDSLRWHAVNNDGELHGMGNLYVSGTIKYTGTTIKTIGADTTLTLGGPNPHNRFEFLSGTNQGQNALNINTIKGRLNLADQLVMSISGLLTVDSGGTLGTMTDGALVMFDGSTLHLKSGATVDNTSTIVMYASTNGSPVTLRATGGNATLTGSGYILTSDSLNNVLETGSNGRITNQNNLIAGGGTIHADITNRGEIRATGTAGIVFEKTASMTGNIVNSGRLVGYGARTADLSSTGSLLISLTPGKLTLKDLNITNFEGATQGVIEASDRVVLDHTTVTGGVVRSLNGGDTTLNNATLAGGATLDIGTASSATVLGGTTSTITGNIVTAPGGVLMLEQGATLKVNTGSTFNSAGGIALSHSSTLTSAVTLTNTGIIGTLTQTSAHTTAVLDALVNNHGTILVNENTTLKLKGGAIVNTHEIVVLSDTSGVSTLRLTADTTLSGGGEVDLGGVRDTGGNGSGTFLYFDGVIRADAGNILFTNVDNTITGRGRLGDGTMSIVNQAAGVIASEGSPSNPLVIETSAGGLTNAGTLRVKSGSRMNITGAGLNNLSGGVLTGGTYDVGGTMQIGGDVTRTAANTTLKLSHTSAAVLNGTGSNALTNYHTNDGTFVVKGGATFANDLTNNGTLKVGDGDAAGNMTGTIANNGSLVFDNTGVGNFDALLTGLGDVIMNGPGRINLTADNGGYTGELTVNGGTFALAAGAKLGGDVTINTGGTLGGFGDYLGDITNNGGNLAPGASPGTLHALGNYTQNYGALVIEVGGLNPGQFDVFQIAGDALLLGGTIEFDFISPFLPQIGDELLFLTAGGLLTLDPSVTFTYTGVALGFLFDVVFDEDGLHFVANSNAEALPVAPEVPEPSTLGLLGLAGLATLRRRRAA